MADDKEKLTAAQIETIKARLAEANNASLNQTTPKVTPPPSQTPTVPTNDADISSSLFSKRDNPETTSPSQTPVVDASSEINPNEINDSNQTTTIPTESKQPEKNLNFDRVKSALTPGRIALTAIIGFFVLLIAGLFVWNQNKQTAQQTPMPSGFAAAGVYIDDSVPTVDFKYLKSQGIDFVYLKATVGDQSIGDNYVSRLKKAQSEGLQTGAVLVYNPDATAYNQFNFLLNQIGQNVGKMPIAIQVNAEAAASQDTQEDLVQLATYISSNYSNGAIVRTTQSGIDELTNVFEQTNFWIIANDTQEQNDRNTLIQFNESKQIGSDVKAIKLPTSVFNGTKEDWNNLLEGE